MEFAGEVAVAQRAVAVSPPGVHRRAAVVDALSLRPGQHVLDIGTGGGHLARDVARAVGSGGRVIGLDASADQLSAAQAADPDAGVEWIEGDAAALDLADASFDAVTSVQTLEYIADLTPVLAEIRRVLRPGGRVATVSVIWDHWAFHGPSDELNRRIHDAWRSHCSHQRLPLHLPTMLRGAGFGGVHQRPLAFVETALHEGTYAYWAARIVAGFGRATGVPGEDVDAWQRQLEEASTTGGFGFVSFPVLTTATRL